MKREEIKQIFSDATDEQINKVMNLNGADVEKAKGKVTSLEDELKEKKEAFEKLTTEFNSLKENNSSAEDWKTKFESLQNDIAEKEKQSAKEKADKEKADRILNRFNAVIGDKKFNHEAIRDSYIKKFGEALENEEYQGKSDTDILHELTKDDKTAFQGVTSFKLEGGNITGSAENENKFKRFF